MCFTLEADLTEKLGQIAHVDKDRSNASEQNLVFLCLKHHSLYDSRTSQHKNYTAKEVKTARSKLYKRLGAEHKIQKTNFEWEQIRHELEQVNNSIRGQSDDEELSRFVQSQARLEMLCNRLARIVDRQCSLEKELDRLSIPAK